MSSLSGLNLHGWKLQLERATWPLVRRAKFKWGYKLGMYDRLCKELDKKSEQLERVYSNDAKFKTFPQGRLIHLNTQIERLEYYVGGATIGADNGKHNLSA